MNLKQLSLFAVTEQGQKLACDIQQDCPFFTAKLRGLDEIEDAFGSDDVLLFIMATGIVVRKIAPLLSHKSRDPAVLVMDQGANYLICLLSGHMGGANDWARQLADWLCQRGWSTQAVITTATDVAGVFAVDVYARDQGFVIDNWQGVKTVNQASVHRQSIHFWLEGHHVLPPKQSHLSVRLVAPLQRSNVGEPPDFISRLENSTEPSVLVSMRALPPQIKSSSLILQLIPRQLWVGVGCQKGKPACEIQAAFSEMMDAYGLSVSAVAGFGTIQLKAAEEGIQALASVYARPLQIFQVDTLKPYETLVSCSDFVCQTAGIGAVSSTVACRLAHLASSLAPNIPLDAVSQNALKKYLLVDKWVKAGVTFSVAVTPNIEIC